MTDRHEPHTTVTGGGEGEVAEVVGAAGDIHLRNVDGDIALLAARATATHSHVTREKVSAKAVKREGEGGGGGMAVSSIISLGLVCMH